ncbi:ribosomal protein L11 [Bradyrhizobium sp. LB9.1b]
MTPFGDWNENRADFGRVIDAEPAALDHGRAAHADRGVLGGDDHVAATEHRGIAGETIARDDSDDRHEAGEPCELHERRTVEAGHAEPVGIAGPAAAAFGVEHQRHAPVFRERQHAVDLLVVHVALRAREHRVVVGHDDAAPALRAELLGVDGRDTHDEAVGRCVLDEIVELAPAPLCAPQSQGCRTP